MAIFRVQRSLGGLPIFSDGSGVSVTPVTPGTVGVAASIQGLIAGAFAGPVIVFSVGTYIPPGGVASMEMVVPKDGIANLGKTSKQPGETLDYDIDFTDWFQGRADAISSVTVTVPDGLTLVASGFTGTVCRLVLAGGMDQQSYKVTVLMRTSAFVPLSRECDFTVKVLEQ